MSDEQDPEHPWNEEQWEKFMKESDVRSAKFGELLETFQDHPDRDAIIEHEMGWDRDDGDETEFEWDNDATEGDEEEELDDSPPPWEEDESEVDLGPEEDDEDEEDENEDDDDDDDDDDEEDDDFDDDERGLKNTPYYSAAFHFGLQVHEQLKPFLVPDDEDQDQDFIDALANGFTIAAKLAGAHGMGYDDDVLCGNIVCCKRSLEAAVECLRALACLRERGLLSPAIADPLLKEGSEVRSLVEQHIAELRSKVWWQ